MMVKVALIGAVLCVTIASVTSLQCFVCNSHRDGACGDPFFPESLALRRSYLLTCPESPDGVKPFCRKTKTYIARNAVTRIHRDCGFLEREGSACYQQRAEDFITDICQCSHDMCNSATSYGAAIFVSLAFPLFLASLL